MSGEGKKASKGVKAQNTRVARGWDKLDKREGFEIDEDRIRAEETAFEEPGSEYRSQVGKGMVGRWAPNAPADEERRLLNKARRHETRYPQLRMDVEKAIEWERQDDDKVLQQRHNFLLSQTVSSKNPFQRALVYERFPILERVPQQYFESMVQDQMRLYYLLQQGEIKSEDDNLFVLKVCHINYTIPVFPIWDPFGKITASWGNSDNRLRAQQGRAHGIFHPRTLGILQNTSVGPRDTVTWDFNRMNASQKLQIVTKCYILKELYPNIREIPRAEASTIMAKIIFGYSSLIQEVQQGDSLFAAGSGREAYLTDANSLQGAVAVIGLLQNDFDNGRIGITQIMSGWSEAAAIAGQA